MSLNIFVRVSNNVLTNFTNRVSNFHPHIIILMKPIAVFTVYLYTLINTVTYYVLEFFLSTMIEI